MKPVHGCEDNIKNEEVRDTSLNVYVYMYMYTLT